MIVFYVLFLSRQVPVWAIVKTIILVTIHVNTMTTVSNLQN